MANTLPMADVPGTRGTGVSANSLRFEFPINVQSRTLMITEPGSTTGSGRFSSRKSIGALEYKTAHLFRSIGNWDGLITYSTNESAIQFGLDMPCHK
jgi:hypothetical protein